MMEKIEGVLNGAFGKYLAFIDWVAVNPHKYVWCSAALVIGALFV